MTPLDEPSRSGLQVSLTSLATSLAGIDDPMFQMQLQLGEQVLRRAVDALIADVNPRNVKDFEFALNDLIGFAGELSEEDGQSLEPSFEALKTELLTIRSSASLPNDLVDRLIELRGRLLTRKKAIEKQTYRDPAAPVEALPHDPATLKTDAARLRDELQRSGFETPVMDKLAEGEDEFRLHDLAELIDEIDVIID